MTACLRSLFSGLMLLSLTLLHARAQAQPMYVLDLKEEINPSTARYMLRGIAEAEAKQARLLLIHMDTYGGLVESAETIRGALLDCKVPTAVLIDRNAGSAGALISLACDSIYMAPGSSIGAATVVDGYTGLAMPDKYQSYFRGLMRSTAEQNHRDPAIAEKMVDQNLDLPGISPAGQVITLTNEEAKKYGYCDGEYSTPEELAWSLGLSPGDIVRYQHSGWEDFAHAVCNPFASAVLIMLIFTGIIMEMKSPGAALPGLLSTAAMMVFFIPHYYLGYAAGWEILIFVIGLAFLALEIWVLPGFGIAGIMGFVFAAGGMMASSLANQDYTFWNIPLVDILKNLAMVMVLMATSILLAIWMARHLFVPKRANPIVDANAQHKSEGYTAARPELEALIGMEAEAASPLMPGGYIQVGERKYDAECKSGYANRGDKLRILAVRSLTLIVEKI